MANIKYTQTAERKRRQDKKSPSSSASGAKHDATKAANASGKQSQPRNRKRNEGNTSAGAPKPKKHRSSNELAALPPHNTMLTDDTIPSDAEDVEELHDEDKEASRFGNEEVSEHDDFERNREDVEDDDDDGHEAGVCENCVKKMKAMEIQDRNYTKLQEEKKVLENRVSLLEAQLSNYNSATSESSVITKRRQIASSIDSKMVSLVVTELFKCKKFASDEVSLFLQNYLLRKTLLTNTFWQNPKHPAQLASSTAVCVSTIKSDWFARECMGLLQKLTSGTIPPETWSADPSLADVVWNGSDFEYPPGTVLPERSPLMRKKYLESCFGGQCILQYHTAQQNLTQYIKNSVGTFINNHICPKHVPLTSFGPQNLAQSKNF